jgi:hypothetical protein
LGTNGTRLRWRGVATFKVTIVNEEFTSSNELECADQLSARKQAISGAFAIAAEQVAAGKPFFGAEVSLEEGNRKIARFVFAAGASPLTLEEQP